MNRKITYLWFIILFLVIGFTNNLFSQCNNAQLEMTTGAGNPTGNGPSISNQVITYQNNTNNPSGNTFSSFSSPTITATYSLSNQQYTNISGLSGVYANGMSFGTALNSNPYQLFPNLGILGSSPSGNFSSSPYLQGQGINAGNSSTTSTTTGVNRGVGMLFITRPLQNAGVALNGKYYYGDLTITFSSAVNRPIINVADFGGNNSTHFFVSELELQGGLTATKLSGDAAVVVNGGNTLTASTVTSTNYMDGSFVVNSNNLTSITFKIYLTGKDLNSTWSGTGSGVTAGEFIVVDVTIPDLVPLTPAPTTAYKSCPGSSYNLTSAFPSKVIGNIYEVHTVSSNPNNSTRIINPQTYSGTGPVYLYAKDSLTGCFSTGALITLDANICPPAFGCNATTYLYKDLPTDVYNLNLTTGNITKTADNLSTTISTGGINAIGYNSIDGYIWGSNNNLNQLSRVNADNSVTNFPVLGGLPSDYSAGTIDNNGIWYGHLNGTTKIMRVDINNTSATFLQKLGELTLPSAYNIVDIAFNPRDGFLYSITNGRVLLKINRTTGATVTVGTVTGGSPAIANDDYGAVFIDSLGNFYVNANTSGRIYRVNAVQNLTSTSSATVLSTTYLATSPSSGNNDGAMCPNVPPCTPPNAPVIVGSGFNICPDTFVNLNNFLPSSISGIDYVWSTNPNYPSVSFHVSSPTAVGAGTYYLYARRLPATSGCYSLASNPIKITIYNPCNDCDSDGVPNEEDLDDDNDGVLDKLEQGCGTTGAWTSLSANVYQAFISPNLKVRVTFDNISGTGSWNGLTPITNFARSCNDYTSEYQPITNVNKPALQFNKTTGSSVGSLQVEYLDANNNPVSLLNPRMHLGGLGGSYGTGTVGSSSWKLLNGKTMTTLSADAIDFGTTSDSIFHKRLFGAGSGVSNCATGEGSGTLMINGSHSSFTFSVRMFGGTFDQMIFMFEGCDQLDIDNDGNINSCDTDSDDDGCPDAYEAGASLSKTATKVSGPYGLNGLANSLENNDSKTATTSFNNNYNSFAIDSNVNLCSFSDCDNDGVVNDLDIDDDNDGILDVVECAPVITNGDFAINNGSGTAIFNTTNTSMFGNWTVSSSSRTAGGVFVRNNGVRIDQNSGIASIEQSISTCEIGRILNVGINWNNGTSPSSGSILKIFYGGTEYARLTTPSGANVTLGTAVGNITYYNGASGNLTSIFDVASTSNVLSNWIIYLPSSISSSGILKFEGTMGATNGDDFLIDNISLTGCKTNTDGDSKCNSCDTDSDNDGCSDAYEGASTVSKTTFILSIPFGFNGLANTIENNDGYNAIVNFFSTYSSYAIDSSENKCNLPDCDNDGIPNVTDIDDDNDGALDVTEGVTEQPGVYNWNVSNISEGTSMSTPSVLSSNILITAASSGVICDTTKATLTLNRMNSSNDYGINFNTNGALTFDNSTSAASNDSIQVTLAYSLPQKVCIQYFAGVFNSTEDYFFEYTGATPTISGTPIANLTVSHNTTTKRISINSSADIAVATMQNLTICFDKLTSLKITRKESGTTGAASAFRYIVYQTCSPDFDGDGIPNSCDLDSDNDGCPDASESGASAQKGKTTVLGPYGANGFANNLETTSESGVVNYANSYTNFALDSSWKNCEDCDGDSIYNFGDIDDDNDGVIDVVECTPTSAIGNGQINYNRWNFTGLSSGNSFYTSLNQHLNPATQNIKYGDVPGTTASPTTSGTVNVNMTCCPGSSPFYEESTANVGHFVQIEGFMALPCYNKSLKIRVVNRGAPAGFGSIRENYSTLHLAYNNGIPTTNTANLSKVSQFKVNFSGAILDSTIFETNNTKSAGKWVRFATVISNGTQRYGTAIMWNIDNTGWVDVPANNFSSTGTGLIAGCVCDNDKDGLPNICDIDSDNDGCNDGLESSATKIGESVPLTGPYGSNGLKNSLELSVDTNIVNYIHSYNLALDSNFNGCNNCDNDSIPNFRDIDDDNDGVLDSIEMNCEVFSNGQFNGGNTSFNSSVSGWTSSTGNAGVFSGQYFYNGSNSAPNAVLYNDLILSANQIYTLNYQLGRSGSGAGNVAVKTDVIDISSGIILKTLTITKNNTSGTTNHSITFMTLASNTRIRFSDASTATNSIDIFLDNVTLKHCNTDGDALPNSCDLDSDNDGCTDAFESKTTTLAGTSIIAGPYGNNGLANSIETNDNQNANVNLTLTYNKAVDSSSFACPIIPDSVWLKPKYPKQPVTACATKDDLPSTSGTINYTSCGMLPNGKGSLSLNSGTGCLTFTGNGTQGPNDTIKTCVVACKNGVCDTTFIFILPPVVPDTVVKKPACPTCPVTVCATKDDIPNIDLITYSSCGVTPSGFGSTLFDNSIGCLTFTPNGNQTSSDTVKSCVIACENGICDTTYIVILPPVKPDTIYIKPACPTCPDTACATKDDLPSGLGITTYRTCGLNPNGTGTETLDSLTGCIIYQPNGTQGATIVQTCIVACKNGICDTTIVIIEPPVKPYTVYIQPKCSTCSDSACATKDDLPSGVGAITYSSCGLSPSGMGSQSLNSVSGCITFIGNGTQGPNDTLITCVIACKNGICDTTVIKILPPIIPDTIIKKPTCPTCPVIVCATMDDVIKDGTTTYSTCGLLPSSAGSISTTLTGCLIYIGNGTQGNDTVKTCVVGCTNGICDTTFIIIPPATPPYGPDSLYITPSCNTCTTTPVCTTADDVPTSYTNITYSNCPATPSGIGTINFNSSTGCLTYTSSPSHIDTIKTCLVKCADTTIGATTITVCDTTFVFIPPPPVPDTLTFYVACDTCSINVCPTADDIIITSSTTFNNCGAPSNYSIVSGPTTSGCYKIKANNPDNIPDTTCVVACNGSVCDTTFIIIIPPPIPDTIIKKPSCPTCPIEFCATKDDLPSGSGSISYNTCGTPSEYSASAVNTTTGCITFTGNGNQDNKNDTTCIVACKNGICDTTYIIIEPPVKPDTVTVYLKCLTCADSVCATKDDLPMGAGTTTYSSCNLNPSGYASQAITPSTGCLVITPNGSAIPSTGLKSCIVACKNGICDTTYIQLYPPPIPDTLIVNVNCDTCRFTSCATADDIIISSSTNFSTCGTPSGYTLVSGPSSSGCYTFKSNNPDTIPDTTCIVACNGSICDTTYLIINPPPVPDTLTKKPICPSCPIEFCATKDDLPAGSGTITYSSCGTPIEYSSSSINSSGCITFTGIGIPDNIPDTSCIVACKNGICDTTYIIIEPPIKPDSVYIKPTCSTCSDSACATKDDLPSGLGTTTYSSCNLMPSSMGNQSLNSTSGCITFTGNGTQGANDTIQTCVVACKNGVCDTTFIFILPPVKPDTVYIKPACPTCSVSACATKDDLPSGLGTTTYSSCNLTPSSMGSQSLNSTSGCVTFTGNGTQGPNDTIQTCVVACKNGICDTTYIYILPPVTPDSIYIKPACPTCPDTACATKNDLPIGIGTVSYSTCGLTPSSMGGQSLNSTNGCIIFTGNGLQGPNDTIKSCIVACKNSICDTTYIFILPPITPDTVYLKPACPTCPDTACATKNDLPSGPGAITYSSCNLNPTGTGNQSINSSTGCLIYTPNGTQGTTTVQTCIVACKNGVCDTTYIIILPPVKPDTVYIEPKCPTCSDSACATKDDLPAGLGTISYSSCGLSPSGFGAQSLNSTTGCITFTGNGTQDIGDTLVTCIVACKNGICDTTVIIIGPPIRPDTIMVKPTCPTCPAIGCATMDNVPKINGTTTYSTCGLNSPYNTMGTVYTTLNGCLVFVGNGTQGSDTVKTCIVGCTNGKCDTTFIIIPPATPPYGPDTLYKTPACGTCAISSTCPTADDIPSGYTNVTFSSCGISGPSSSMGTWNYNSSTGCGIWTPNGTQSDTVITCLIKCADTTIGATTFTVCDTTYLIFPPPPIPDTIIIQSICKTCTVKACPTADDIELLSTTTYQNCGIPIGYNQVGSVDAFGCITYIPSGPNPNPDTTCVIACNGTVCDTTFVIILPPIEPDTVIVKLNCNTCSVIACATKDDLFGTGPYSYSSCGNPTNFTSSINNTTGCITFTPNGNQDDIADTTCIIACQNGKCDTTYIIIIPSDPKPNPDVNITWTNFPVNGNVSTNDNDIPVGSIYSSPSALSGNPGTAIPVLNNNGTYTFNSSVPGIFYFNVPIITPSGDTLIVELKITVLEESNKTTSLPVANTDIATTPMNTSVTLKTLSNDLSGIKNIGLDPSTVTVTNSPSNGTFSVNPITGDITYTPNSGFTGIDTLFYSVEDDLGNITTAMQIITVIPSGSSNTTSASDDYKYTNYNTPANGNVKFNDHDPEGNGTRIIPQTTTITGKGTLVLDSIGNYIFTPDSTFTGPVNFPYTVCDSGSPVKCVKATLYILVGSKEVSTFAVDDDNNTLENIPVSGKLLTNDFDPQGDQQTFGSFLNQNGSGIPISSGSVISGVDKNGSPISNAGIITFANGNYTYTPASGFVGEINIHYSVCDNSNPMSCDTAILKIVVDPLPDALDSATNSIITNNDDNVSYGDPVGGNVLSNDSDPNKDAFDPSTFTFTNQNGSGTPISSGATLNGIDKLGNAISNAGTLTFAADGSYTFTPNSGFYGVVKVPYIQCDVVPSPNTACKTAYLEISIIQPQDTNKNLPPFAGDDFTSTSVNQIKNANWFENDNDPDKDSFSVNGTLVYIKSGVAGTSTSIGTYSTEKGGTIQMFADGTYIYTPPLDYYGPDQMVYEICDKSVKTPQPLCDKATIYIIITPANEDYSDLDSTIWGFANNRISPDKNGDFVPENPKSIWLGTIIDAEYPGSFSTNADQDDLNNQSDEDGLTYPPLIYPLGIVDFEVVVNGNTSGDTAYFGLWIDWDGNGTFDTFKDSFGVVSSPVSVTVSVEVPATYTLGNVVTRLRTSNSPLTFADATGLIMNGETEDYIRLVPLPIYPTLTSEWIGKNAKLKTNIEGFNVSKYIVWRSIDNMPYEVIYSGVYNSENQNQLSYADINVYTKCESIVKYRIELIDNNNSSYNTNISLLRKLEFDGPPNVEIYPNPTSSILVLSSDVEMLEFKLIDLNGKQVYHQEINSRNYVFDVKKISYGIYYLKIKIDEQTEIVKKVVIIN